MTDMKERAQRAHRGAFALVTAALNNPGGVDLEPDILGHVHDTEDTAQSILDLSQVLVWHAAGAIVAHAGSQDDALALLQGAALQQETHFQEEHDEQ